MNEQLAIEVARNALIVAFELAGPLLAGSLVVAGMLVFLGPWMGQTLVTYTVNVFNSVATLAR